MGLVNTVVPLEDLEVETVEWCRAHARAQPAALRMIKASLQRGRRRHRGHPAARRRSAGFLYYTTEEAQEGKRGDLEQRRPEFDWFPKRPRARGAVAASRPRRGSRCWVRGAWPRTLGAAVSPVIVGTCAVVPTRTA